MHFPATAWQENCISRFPAERLWCLIANPLPARAGDFLFLEESSVIIGNK